MKPLVGMYVHCHWAYNHPYAARTWTLDDWRSYARGLSALGYNFVLIWPVLETMPDPPTASDIAQLEKIGKVIDLLHSEFKMAVYITLGPNTIGSAKAAQFAWEQRPFFDTDLRLNPGDPAEVERLLRVRRQQIKHIAHADGFSIIDSDPGGYVGSTNAEFADLMMRHFDLWREFNPSARLYYWMWVGWESYNRFWENVHKAGEFSITWDEKDWTETLELLLGRGDDNWGVFACGPGHQKVTEQMGLEDRAIFFPYGLVEGEPTFPLTNCFPQRIEEDMRRHKPSVYEGAMANAQTHAVQQPNTYLFAHFARGGTASEIDLPGFADGLIPGLGEPISEAWQVINTEHTKRARKLAALLKAESVRPHAEGPYSGLLLGRPECYLEDLSMQLAFAADIQDFARTADSGGSSMPHLRALVGSWREWMSQTGFADAYHGPVHTTLHPALAKLNTPAINAVLHDFDDWRNPSVRHGIVRRLLEAISKAG